MLKVSTSKCGQKNTLLKSKNMMKNKIMKAIKKMKKRKKLHYLTMNKLIQEKSMNFYSKKANQAY